MPIEPWHLGAAAVFALAHFVLTVIAVRQFTDGGAQSDAVAGDTVACPECGVSNDADYRFCQACVSELPGGTRTLGSGSRPEGGRFPN